MTIVEAEHPAGVPVSVSVEIGGKEISFETGKIAKQADGAVLVRSGDTVVLGTAQGRTEAREGADFFPLTVDVEERMYAAGKIPGGFFKREGRPTERAILTARMTDRPVRPLWPKGYRNETQCVATVFSADMVIAHDVLCINAVSAALTVSPLPFLGPIGAVRMGLAGRRPRRQPDARGDRGLRSRPDRRRHEGRPDDGRGGREPGARGEAPRGARDRSPRDREALRRPARSCARSGARRSGSTRPSPSGSRAHTATRSGSASSSRACARPLRSSRRSSRRKSALRRWTPTRRRSSASCRCACRWRRSSRSSARSPSRRCPRAVRARAARPHRGGAGLEGAQVGEAQPALRPHRREGASCRSRSARRRRRRARRQGFADEGLRQQGVRVDLQEPRPAEDRGREASPGRPDCHADPPDRGRGVGDAPARTVPGSSPAARRRS